MPAVLIRVVDWDPRRVPADRRPGPARLPGPGSGQARAWGDARLTLWGAYSRSQTQGTPSDLLFLADRSL
ncbi:hypothetical protein GCM10010503_52770 [Streptomyces lucensis JCM 4490]|uniref:Uncharacterized protein n=1 Tax=Streptomyces lucensis JCM 4490 TaxID=1306176 RepID=A0A918JB24_9ACTN|nr:hypothetical protein GCM10010503_52770 [Streptomyces lucensis JCM 4490]